MVCVFLAVSMTFGLDIDCSVLGPSGLVIFYHGYLCGRRGRGIASDVLKWRGAF